MNWSSWIRKMHRWLSIAFTVAVLANIVAMVPSGEMPPAWITYSPLPPLALLWFTGMYLLVLPHAIKWRHRRRPV